MIKRLNKRGQAQDNTVNWIFAVVVLVLLVLIVWGIYSYVTKAAKVAPDDLRIAAAYCENSPFEDSDDQYCNDFKEFKVGDSVLYYNCVEIRKLSNNNKIKEVSCDPDISTKYCTTLNSLSRIEKGDDVKINEQSCSYTLKSGEICSDTDVCSTGLACLKDDSKSTAEKEVKTCQQAK